MQSKNMKRLSRTLGRAVWNAACSPTNERAIVRSTETLERTGARVLRAKSNVYPTPCTGGAWRD